jgi:transcription initiation factor TFIIIB Brf1 subunit/transcription initiation factor TFIIB
MAYQFLKKIEDSKELKGRSLEAKIAIVIFLASRKTGKSRKISDILKYAKTNEREISQSYKKLKNTILSDNDIRIQPSDIVQQACNSLKYPMHV